MARIALGKPYIIGITETNPKNATWSLTLEDVSIDGYTTYANLRGRGITLYIKQGLHSAEFEKNSEHNDSVWCKVSLRNKDTMIVGVVSRSPNATDIKNRQLQLMSTITEIADSKPSHLLIVVDFNYPDIKCSDYTSEGSLQEQWFIENVMDWFMWQHCQQPTRYRNGQQSNIRSLRLFTWASLAGKMLQA